MDVTGMPHHLGWWVNTQRNFHLKGRLGADRELRLQALPGWAWSAKAQQWEEGFSQLLQYVECHGHARVPYVHRRWLQARWLGRDAPPKLRRGHPRHRSPTPTPGATRLDLAP